MQNKHSARQTVPQSSRIRPKKHFLLKNRPSAVVPGDAVCQQQTTLGHLVGAGHESHKFVLDNSDHDQPTCSGNQAKSGKINSSKSEISEDYTAVISVCMGKHCSKRGSKNVMKALSKSAEEFPNSIEVTCSSCLGQCKRGPSVHVKMSTGEEVMCVRVDQQNSVRQLTLAAVDDISWAF